MNARVLAFPLAVAGIAAFDGCKGIDINSPMVRPCHDDTLEIVLVFPGNRVTRDTMVVHDNPAYCRKAA